MWQNEDGKQGCEKPVTDEELLHWYLYNTG